jgi:hypothetical protein
VTEVATDDWDAGPAPDEDPVPSGIPLTFPSGVPPADPQSVPPGDVPPDPIDVGRWQVAADGEEDSRDGGLSAVAARLAALVSGSPLLGGGSLAAEVADPKPGTWSQHWHHVTRHEDLPDGTGRAIGFVAGHLAVTGPLKMAGKAMTATGKALQWTGTRTDRASDHFASAVIFIVLAAAIISITVIAVGQVISWLL